MTPGHVRLVPALLAVLVALLAGCGSSQPAELASADGAAPALAADLQPLHAEAVELADLVLAAGPSEQTAAVVQRVRDDSAALLEQAEQALAGTSPGELGALTEPEIEAVRTAVGEEAVRLGLDGLLRNHVAAVTRAKAEVSRSTQGAARELADRVLEVQGPALQELPSS